MGWWVADIYSGFLMASAALLVGGLVFVLLVICLRAALMLSARLYYGRNTEATNKSAPVGSNGAGD